MFDDRKFILLFSYFHSFFIQLKQSHLVVIYALFLFCFFLFLFSYFPSYDPNKTLRKKELVNPIVPKKVIDLHFLNS